MKRTAPLARKTRLAKTNQKRLDKRTREYRRYMASEAWAERRLNALIAADYTCQRCGWKPPYGLVRIGHVIAPDALHVHHRTYASFGRERPEHLEVLCESCHRAEHAGRFIKPRGLRGGR